MPVYEYACKECEGRFEYFQRVTEPPRESCERCGGELVKLISSTSFVLKGGGWYKDGYGAGRTTPAADEKKNATESSGAAKPEKPEAKPAPKKTEPVGTPG